MTILHAVAGQLCGPYYCCDYTVLADLSSRLWYSSKAAVAERVMLPCYRGLVVIGSPRTLWDNDNWHKWLEWVKENKAVLHSDVVKQG